LPATCGPNGTASCCASSVVPGVSTASFYRSYDGVTAGYTAKTYPAQVSDFRLDTYEITVGRFRRFVAAYSQTLIEPGTGKNPNNPSDTGWDPAWNDNLPPTSGVLVKNLGCTYQVPTWNDTAGVGENLPINCVTWFEAEAFCIWDGGRLPTEAEWNYAAAGGTSQRVYPWGSAYPSCSYTNYYGGAFGKDFCVEPPEGYLDFVGQTSPLGDGAYGQADLAGNVAEWVQDGYDTSYPTPCNNCSNLTTATKRGVRGGAFDSVATGLITSIRSGASPSTRGFALGARCARRL